MPAHQYATADDLTELAAAALDYLARTARRDSARAARKSAGQSAAAAASSGGSTA